MKHWEINGNLDDELTGLKNYSVFATAVHKVKILFDMVFGPDIINRVDFYVDNATADSGYAPSATPVLQKVVFIKLNIFPNDTEPKIAYQFSHELTHVIFYSLLGLNKPLANETEETICSAASLITLKALYPSAFPLYKKHVETLSNTAYRNGAALAEELHYDTKALKDLIIDLCLNHPSALL